MEFIEKAKNYLMTLPVIGKILTSLIIIYAVNELIDKITLGKFNILQKSINLISKLYKRRSLSVKDKFYKTIGTKEFLQWELDLIKKLYNVCCKIKVPNVASKKYIVLQL